MIYWTHSGSNSQSTMETKNEQNLLQSELALHA